MKFNLILYMHRHTQIPSVPLVNVPVRNFTDDAEKFLWTFYQLRK